MLLDEFSLPSYLKVRGLSNDLNISSDPVIGKNNNFLVKTECRNFFVKQFLSLRIDYKLLCEVEMCISATDSAHYCELINIDPANEISVYSGLVGKNLDRHIISLDVWRAKDLAREISELMKSFSSGLAGFLADVPKKPHWVVDLLSPPVEVLRNISPAQLQLLQFVQSCQVLENALSIVRESWSASCVIHGDIRHQNILIASETAFILDLEMIQAGPVYWDHAAATAAMLTSWILSFPINSSKYVEVSDALVPVEIINNMIQLMMEEAPASENYTEMVSANLVKNAFEGAAGLNYIPPASVYLLQIAQNFPGQLFGGAHGKI